ncbi:hypothetical protein CLU95_3616 [Variovorax sp. 54]|nr:hypothetical protein CLU95_3616 [Variovorax sp. 54]
MACFPLIGGLALGSHAGDGVIHFVGAIVAAPYEIAPAPPPARMKVASARGRQAELVFVREAVDRPSARVKVETVHTQAVSARFMDSQGRARAIDPAQWHVIGQHGGTLSLRTSAAPPAGGPSAALVTVAYD